MEKLVLKQIREMDSYNPPIERREKFDGLKLDFNERLSPLSKTVIRAIQNFDSKRTLLYPAYGQLENRIANYAGVKKENILITNGSDQGMEIISRTFVSLEDKVIIPSPSFAMFYQVAQIQGAEILKPKYKKDGSFPFEDVLQLLEKNPKLLIICNPNNPTGTLISLNKIENILKKATDTIVYIDEAYFEFSNVTASKLIDKYPNLCITRTFSKAFGLAALRIGYMISNQKNIDEFRKVRGPYDVNQVAKIAAEASLASMSDLKKYCDEIMRSSKPMIETFFTKNGIEYFPSSGNFIYFKEPFEGFSKKLEENGILIRPRENGYARVTIGIVKQMNEFIKIFSKVTNEYESKICIS